MRKSMRMTNTRPPEEGESPKLPRTTYSGNLCLEELRSASEPWASWSKVMSAERMSLPNVAWVARTLLSCSAVLCVEPNKVRQFHVTSLNLGGIGS